MVHHFCQIAEWIRRQYWRLRLTPTAIAVQGWINKAVRIVTPALAIRTLASRIFSYSRDLVFAAVAIYAGFFYIPAYELPVAAAERHPTSIPWFLNDKKDHFETDYTAIKFEAPVFADRVTVKQENYGTFFVVQQPGWYAVSVRFLQPESRNFVNALMNYYRLDSIRPVRPGLDEPNTIATGPGYGRGWKTNVIGFDYKCLSEGDVIAFTLGMAIPIADPGASVPPNIAATVRIALANPPKEQSYWERAVRWIRQKLSRDGSGVKPPCN